MMNFLGLRIPGPRKDIRGFRRVKPAVSPAARPIPLTQAQARVVEAMPSKLKVEERRKTATASERKTAPVESPKQRRSGAKVGGRAPRKPTNVGRNDTLIGMAPTYLKGPQKSTVISHAEYDAGSPPPPIEVAYEVGQTGSSKRLDEYKKMYKGSTYELDTPTLSVGGSGSNASRKFRPSTMAGFGRKNVVWPYWINDYYATSSDDHLTSRTSCFNRSQVEDLIFKMWQNVGVPNPTLNGLIDDLENAVGGDTRIDFPLDYIEVEYKYFNNNTALPIDMSLYICTPKRNLTYNHSPMSDWFNPAVELNEDTTEHMLADYCYEPTLTAAQDVMFNNSSGTLSNINIRARAGSILTASTEVVPEATPQSFSIKFQRNWQVLQVQDFQLMPQQELKVTCRVKFSKMLDFNMLFGSESSADAYHNFADLSIFPMVTFQGSDTTAVSENLKRQGVTDMNRFLDTTAPRSSASMLSSSMTAKARVHTKSAPLRDFRGTYNYTIGDILDVFSVSKRELLPYNDIERGEQCPYYQVNDNLGYFCDKTDKPTSNYHLTQLVTLNVKGAGLGPLPTAAEPAVDQLSAVSTDDDWALLESKTISRATVEKTGADISG